MRIKSLLLLSAGLLLSIPSLKAQQPSSSPSTQKIRTLVNLLDYVGKDYPNAVADGKVQSKLEYQEMLEFSDRIRSLHEQLTPQIDNNSFGRLDNDITALVNAIKEKAVPHEVGRQAANIQQQILSLNLITITPSKQPDIAHGKQLFQTYCSSCHGNLGHGNGPLAKQLNPKPSNFHDDTLAAKLSPLQAYNTIRLGIEGTGMRSFTELSDQEVWDIAFYVNKLNYSSQISEAKSQHIRNVLKDTASLQTLTTWKNEQWQAYFQDKNIDVKDGMAVLRSMETLQSSDEDYLAKAVSLLNSAGEAYSDGQPEKAHQLALNAYLHGVEPMESQIKASDPGMVSDIENKMIDTRSAIKEHEPAQKVQQKIQEATASIRQAQNLLSNQDYSFWFTFTMASSILLREGLEAVLIILVIISVLKSMGAHRSLKYVHGGWLTALGIGIISWFFARTLIQMSSFQREMMEGIGSLIAVGMLIYIGFWLHNKTHASQWTKFVKEKITRLVDENNRWGLAALAFIVVFREAFESVIFLSSISIKSTSAGNSGIMLGSISALVIVLVLAALIIRFSKRLPIRSLFKYSSFVMSLLAVVLVGKGIHEFQEAGYLGIHSIPALPNLPILGLYPTLFTIMAQLLIIGVIAGLWQLSKRMAVTSAAG